ncbi:MAG: hypothetical protein ACOH18_01145 [Candidatus Saccharimonadaceae bacterium]
MANDILVSSVRNFEKIGRRRTQPKVVSRPSRRERRVQHELNHGKVASRVCYKLLTEFEGWYECELSLFELAATMEDRGVINRNVVHDHAVRLGVIVNVIEELIDTKRLTSDRVLKNGKFAQFIWLSPDERAVQKVEFDGQNAKLEARSQERRERRDAARAAATPAAVDRRRQRRQATNLRLV